VNEDGPPNDPPFRRYHCCRDDRPTPGGDGIRVDHSTISRLVSGKRAPSLATATKLADALRKLDGIQHVGDYFWRLAESRGRPPGVSRRRCSVMTSWTTRTCAS